MKEILNAIEALLGKWLGVDPTAIVIFLVPALGLIYWRSKYYQDVLKSPLGLAGVRERLAAHGGWRKAYFGHLRRALAWVDKGLGPSAWSTDSYEFTLTMAFTYPFASLFVVWILTNHNTSGISTMLPGNLPLWGRAVVLAAVCINAFLGYRFLIAEGWRTWAYFALGVGISGGAWGFGLGGVTIGAFGLAVATMGGSVVSMIMTIVSGVGAGIVAARAGAGAGASAFLIFGFAGGVGVSSVFGQIEKQLSRIGLRNLFFLLFVSISLCLLAFECSRFAWIGQRFIERVSSAPMIFWGVLPLINSVFDWLSLASSRWLLKGMAKDKGAPAVLVAGNAVAGLALGVLLLAGLAVTITAALQTMNLLSQGNGGPELFDLAGTLHRLRTNPSDVSVWWVYFTLFSTMLPTVFHAAVASASFVTWRLPDSWKTHWLNLIGPTKDIKDDHPLLVGMSLRMTAIDVLTVILATLGTAFLAWMLFWLMPYEGRDLLWLCQKVAEWLGAPITV